MTDNRREELAFRQVVKLQFATTIIVARIIAPDEFGALAVALVAQTIKLNKSLAKETVSANRTGAYIKIVADFVTAATQVITGKVPPAEKNTG